MAKFDSICLFILVLLTGMNSGTSAQGTFLPVYTDVPFLQDYSVKYDYRHGSQLKKVFSDRNGVIRILSSDGLLQPHCGFFLYPGTLEPDRTYRPMAGKKIVNMLNYDGQFVYLDDKAVLSNAWAGKLLEKHGMPSATVFAGGEDFMFLVADGKNLKCIQNSKELWKGELKNQPLSIKYNQGDHLFWLLDQQSLSTFNPRTKELKTVIAGENFTAFDMVDSCRKTVIGTKDGYLEISNGTKKQTGVIHNNLPCNEITAVAEINGNLWFGSARGAFMLRDDGKFNYYYGERWLPGNQVVHIAEGPGQSVLILTENGLGQVCFKKITLEQKALYFEQQVRRRHIRYGFNATLSGLDHGNLSSGYLDDSDNDGLWTSMYLGSQIFRYAVTRSAEALQNCSESLDAMERLYSINPVPGFPSRSFERSGYIEILSDPERWQHAPDPEWDWKATTSSDEAIGHIFALGAFAELIDAEPLRARAIHLIDQLMQHIVDHDLYLVDYDGNPTTWGKWNPDYVNALPVMVGDRKINSSNIIAMLQTAWHFTKKEGYREKAFELMEKHGYLENLMRPMKEIGQAPADADDRSKMLSEGWNHSDDEMYFLGYWGLYRYAFNDTLKARYKEAIIDHWQIERPEKDGLWNLFTALVSPGFDLDEAVWYLREHPLDLITWEVVNSQRKDIQLTGPNFRGQTTTGVLPPDERPVQRHNANMFRMDKTNGNGSSEYSAGDIWLLPYWLGRYLGVISEPVMN